MKLSELNNLVKEVISGAFQSKMWVVGEICEIKVNRSGHCYLLLIEKDNLSDAVIAQARATIWSYVFRMLRPYFETTTGQILTEGIKVMVQVTVEFHEIYGYSLNIHDIDPTYTLGDLARRKAEIISRLQREGIFDMNREIDFPEVPQKIAVISSETAAGYQDFMNQLNSNQAGYKFHLKLFPAIMQGSQTESSVIRSLDRIYQYEDFFDVVVIIRGGGSQLDLSAFDNYNLALHVTQFPLPVITGIGHEKDNSVVDLVAHTRLKTPTAVAEYLIGTAARFDLRLEECKAALTQQTDEILDQSGKILDRLINLAGPVLRNKIGQRLQVLNQKLWKTDQLVKLNISSNDHRLNNKKELLYRYLQFRFSSENKKLDVTGGLALSGLKNLIPASRLGLNKNAVLLKHTLQNIFISQSHKIDLVTQKNALMDPRSVLARGYSITTCNGSIIKDAALVEQGEIIRTVLYEGTLVSQVVEKE